MPITRSAFIALTAAAWTLAANGGALAQRANDELRSVLVRDEWVREWVVRIESSSRVLGEPVDAPGTEPDRIRIAYPLPVTFGWGGIYNDTLWASVGLPSGRTGDEFFLELADDGTTNIISEVPNPSGVLEFDYRAMYTIQTHAITDIDEQRATSQYGWPGVYPADIAGYLEPEPFIESNHERIKALVGRATRNRSPRSVPPYQLAKHLAAEVMQHGTGVGSGNTFVPEIFQRNADGQIIPDRQNTGLRASDPRSSLSRLMLNPDPAFDLIRAIGRHMSGARAMRTLLNGQFPGVSAPPEPVYFRRANNRLPNLRDHLQFCAPRDGFFVQSALHASLGEQVTEEGLANLLVAVYRAAGIPARLTIVIDQRDVLRRNGMEPIVVEVGELERATGPFDMSRGRPIRLRPIRRLSPPRLIQPRIRPDVDWKLPPMEPNDEVVPSHVGGFPTNAIFRPLVEFYLTREGDEQGEWIPVDVVRMRTEFSPPPALDVKWEHFGRIRNADLLIPVAHHWVAPGHAFTDRPHLWGLWPGFGARTRDGRSAHRSFTCIWATERIITGEPEPERSLILPARSPH